MNIGKMKKAFTLLELLLVIAIVASLAGVIISALNPAARLDQANEAKVTAKAQDIRKAVEAYSLANNGSLPANISSLNSYGFYDICKAGQSTDCINLDILVTDGYLSAIPIDDKNDTNTITGYKLEYNPTKRSVTTYSYTNYFNLIENSSTLTTNLLGWWKLDEGSGSSTADSKGGYTGTLLNSPTWVTGKYTNGLQFSGSNYVSTTLSRPESGTISLWAYPTAFNSWISPIGWKVSGRFLLIDEGGGPTPGNWRASFKPTASEITITGPAITQNSWTHLVYTWSLSGSTYTFKFYVNGTSVGTTTWTGTPDTDMGVLYMGTAGQIVSNNYTGRVDEVRIYGRAINADEVTALYNSAPSPVAHWKFDDGSGTTASDSSGNTNNGTLTNGPTWTTGKYNSAVNFDGVNDTVVMGDLSYTKSLPFTVTAWIKSNGSSSAIINKYVPASYNGFNFFIQSGKLCAWYLRNSVDHISIAQDHGFGSVPCQSFTSNTWNHAVVSVDSTEMKLYLNGNLSQTASWTGTAGGTSETTPFSLGLYGSYFTGQIDDVRVYKAVLNQTQIQKVMDNEI